VIYKNCQRTEFKYKCWNRNVFCFKTVKTNNCLSKHPSDVIERVTTFKLLGVTLSSDLSWEAHMNAMCAKVAPQLYYLKQLRRAGLPSGDLLYLYLTVIRPVLEYRCAVWHHGLTVPQSHKLESLQKRALRIIHQIVCDMPYDSACAYVGVHCCTTPLCPEV